MPTMDQQTPPAAVMPGSDIAIPTQAVLTLLSELEVDRDDWVRVLGSAFVVAGVAPFLSDGLDSPAVHARMQRIDQELALAVEALAPLLLRREQVQREAASALAEVERLVS